MKTPIEALQFEINWIKSFADKLQAASENPNKGEKIDTLLKETKDFIAQYEEAIKVLKISISPLLSDEICDFCCKPMTNKKLRTCDEHSINRRM